MNEIPFRPVLPIKEGFVEVLDVDGNHVYQPTPEQQEKENQLKTNATISEQLSQSDDAAIALFEAQAATDAAIITIYEKIGG